MAFTTPGTAVAGEVLTAAFWNTNVRDNLNAVALGLVGYSATATQISLATTETDILSVTFTAEANHNYMVVAGVSGIIKQTNAGNVTFKITDGSNNERARWINNLAINDSWPTAWLFEFIRNASAGSVTRKSRQSASSAGGVFNRGDLAANNQTLLAVIDLGNTSV